MTAFSPRQDLVKGHFPAFAEFRDRLGMRTTSLTDAGVHWVVRLETDSFSLVISRDRGDNNFYIGLIGSRQDWSVPQVLHDMGLLGDVRERMNAEKLARALEQNLADVLRHLAAR
jgi:hypothetical protein